MALVRQALKNALLGLAWVFLVLALVVMLIGPCLVGAWVVPEAWRSGWLTPEDQLRLELAVDGLSGLLALAGAALQHLSKMKRLR